MFKIGQLVRLRHGHTPMQVIGTTADGKIIAKYCHKYPICDSDFATPQYSIGIQTRYPSEFCFWEGYIPTHIHHSMFRNPITPEIMLKYQQTRLAKKAIPMQQQQYILKRVTGHVKAIIGVQLAVTSQGMWVMEMSDGSVQVQHPDNVQPHYQRAMLVQSINSSYRCNYLIPPKANVSVDDYIISDSDNIYRVLAVDVEGPGTNIKGMFKGKKLKMKDL